MNAKNTIMRIPLLLRIKAAIIAFTPALAWAVEQSVHRDGIEDVTAWAWFFIVLFSLLGWAVSDLDKIAEVLNTEHASPYQRWKEQLKVIKGVIGSIAAGIGTFFIGKVAPTIFMGAAGLKTASGSPPDMPEMMLFVFVAAAGYMGSRWFAWIERRITGGS